MWYYKLPPIPPHSSYAHIKGIHSHVDYGFFYFVGMIASNEAQTTAL